MSTDITIKGTSSTADSSASFPLWSTASNDHSETRVKFNMTASAVAEAESIIEENWIRSHYELVPKRTIADLAKAYEARVARQPHKKYIDVDLPMVDDGGDW